MFDTIMQALALSLLHFTSFQMRIPRDGGHDSMLMADSVPA
ncbi:hypothetical protein [Diaphorobacter sp. LI3]